MDILEEAIIYATTLHEGKVRKLKNIPYILHPLEVAQIIATMTDDQEIMAAGVLHDVVEDTDTTLDAIREKFGDRIAALVESETENKYPGEDKSLTWKRRKEESLLVLKNSKDIGVKMLWLSDKLSNIRSLSRIYGERGKDLWNSFNQSDPMMHRWYYMTVAQYVEYDLNRTGAYKEFIKQINYLWPGTFDTEKTRYRKYREVSVEGCSVIGHGAKGDVYRYDDELIIKVYNESNTYKDVEREVMLARKAFVLGLPTAVTFGIVAVGNRYGTMYELIDSSSVSALITSHPEEVDRYAKIMSDVAHAIHGTETDENCFQDASQMMTTWVSEGIGYLDEALAAKIQTLIDSLPPTKHLVHGDFHTGNVLMNGSEPVLIDLDCLSVGHPVLDLSIIYMSYVAIGEEEPDKVRQFMGFSYDTALSFFDCFMKEYFKGLTEEAIREATDKAALLCYVRLIRKYRKRTDLSHKEERLQRLLAKERELILRVSSLEL